MPDNFRYSNGLGHAPAYQVSSIPFATGSLSVEASSGTPLKIEFPRVTSWVTIVNRSSQHLRVGFSANGIKGTNYFTVHEDNHPTHNRYDLKVTEVYFLSHGTAITSQVDIIAGLTTIETGSILNNWSGSAGVG